MASIPPPQPPPPRSPSYKIFTISREPAPPPVLPPKLPDPAGFNCNTCLYCVPRNPKGEIMNAAALARYEKYKEEGGPSQDELVRVECSIHWCSEEAAAKKAAEAAKEKKDGENDSEKKGDATKEEAGEDTQDFVVTHKGAKLKVLEVIKAGKKGKPPKQKAASKAERKPTGSKMSKDKKDNKARDFESNSARSQSSTSETSSSARTDGSDSNSKEGEEKEIVKRPKERERKTVVLEGNWALKFLLNF